MDFLHFLLGCFAIGAVHSCWQRYMRHLDISKSGWPPPHCDSDGDPVERDCDDCACACESCKF